MDVRMVEINIGMLPSQNMDLKTPIESNPLIKMARYELKKSFSINTEQNSFEKKNRTE